MSDASRIPRGIDAFSPYIGTTATYLTAGTPETNAERLGVLPKEVAQWTSFSVEWIPLYTLYCDKLNGRTTAVTNRLYDIIDRCITFDQTYHILDRIAASPNVTIVDLSTFNIKKGALQKTTRSVATTPISEPVLAALQALGGGSFYIKCRSTTSERASILEGADCVQFVYVVGDTPPTSAEMAGLSKDISTKACFTLQLGAGSSAKYLYIYFRWYNTKHPELAGPWSSMQMSLIM
ncbi:MAG: hypothetical protein Q8909_08450 [Bacteroidota bacterium]|nr:hypothetical protein [Bacteroidota bacterium]